MKRALLIILGVIGSLIALAIVFTVWFKLHLWVFQKACAWAVVNEQWLGWLKWLK